MGVNGAGQPSLPTRAWNQAKNEVGLVFYAAEYAAGKGIEKTVSIFGNKKTAKSYGEVANDQKISMKNCWEGLKSGGAYYDPKKGTKTNRLEQEIRNSRQELRENLNKSSESSYYSDY
jgi:hypothetical protein